MKLKQLEEFINDKHTSMHKRNEVFEKVIPKLLKVVKASMEYHDAEQNYICCNPDNECIVECYNAKEEYRKDYIASYKELESED